MAAEESGADIITVGKVSDDGKAVWDRDPLHPANYEQSEGEVFISDMRPYQVHRSAGISQKLGEKAIRELGSDRAAERLKLHEEAEAKRAKVREQALENASGSATTVVPAPAPVGEPLVDESDEDDLDTGEDKPRVARPRGRGQQQETPPDR
jgi:hypothetical protein